MTTPTKYIIHTADLHIGSGNRSAEYRAVFDSFIQRVNNFPNLDQLVVVIAGDIFHHKNRYSGQDVLDFQYLIDNLKPPVIIIPGNHDTNLNNNQADLLSPLCTNQNIHYWKDSGDYELCGQKYYHCSVFDNSTAQDIAKLDLTGKIFLYHGMVNGCKFGRYTEHNTRITITTLNSAKLALLGDIHQHQYVTPTAAYPGSLIQQNLGESAEKGFIIWDLETLQPTFIPIPNNSGFVRIDLRGITNYSEHIKSIVQPTNLLKVSFITDAQGEEYTEQLATVHQSFKNIDLINQISTQTPVILAEDITETLAEILLANNATEEQLDEIINLHAQKINQQLQSKWTITLMQWSNLFKYGPDNTIDFTKFNNGGVIAENMAGKSSIIDILVFALYNEHLRADRLSMINTTSNRAHVRVYFETNNAKYYIDRTDDRSKNNKIQLCKMNTTTDDKWENITDISIDTTYRKIRGIIGPIEHFLSTGLYYDTLNTPRDVIKMNKVERMRILPELFGLTDNESILKDIKTKIKTIKEKINLLVKPRGSATDEQIANNLSQTNQLQQVTDELNAALQITSTEISIYTTLLHNQRPAKTVQRDIDAAKRKMDALHVELETLKTQPMSSTPVAPCKLNATEIDSLRKTAQINTQPSSSLSTQIAIIINSLPVESYNIKILNKQLEIYKQQRSVLKTKEVILQPQSTVDPIELEKKIADLRSKIKPVSVPNSDQVDSLKAASVFTFNPDCTACGVTKIHLANDLHLAELSLKEQTAAFSTQFALNSRLNDEIAALSIELSAAQQQSAIRLKTMVIENENLIVMNKQRDLDAEIRKIEAAQLSYHESHDRSVKCAELKQQLQLSQQVESAIASLNHYKDHAEYQTFLRYETKTKELHLYTDQHRQFVDELAAIDPVDQEYLATQRCNLQDIQKQISENNKQLGMFTVQLTTLQTEHKIKTTYDAAYPPLQAELDKFNLYATCIGSAGLRMAVIKKNMARCIAAVNAVLSLISTFKIRCEIIDQSNKPQVLDLFIDYDTYSTPIALGSGFQQFIISIAFRLVLTQQLSSSAEFIIIDEGFGSLDHKHRAKLTDFFTLINSSLKFTFIISHIDDIQSIIQQPIYIRNHNGHSYVNNANSTDNTQTVQTDTPTIIKKNTVITVKPVPTVKCVCGVEVTRKSYPAHLKSAKHIARMTQK